MIDHKPDLSKPYLRTQSLSPENQETPIHFLRSWITPTEYFYRRNHFSYPELPAQAFFLPITGEVRKAMVFPYEMLKSLPARTVTMVLECSGNKRQNFQPRTYGEQWGDGAISQGIWKGVALRDLLDIVGIKDSAVEVVFEGYDHGTRTDMGGTFPYARSLPLEKALHPDTLIAYELNDQPIPFENGFPIRLIVPQWYAMASVKWIKQITLIPQKFSGPFQVIDYMYYPYKENDLGKEPVTTIKTDSIIQQPSDYTTLDAGVHYIYGIAWTGNGKIGEVEISLDGGETWIKAEMEQGQNQPYAWIFWKYRWRAIEPGEYTIMSRAKDTDRNIQPMEAAWNRKGYGYNAIYTIHVKIE